MHAAQEQEHEEVKETIHIYVIREKERRSSLAPVVCAVLLLLVVIAYGVLTPYEQPEAQAIIRVPAVLLPLTTFTASVKIIQTGIQHHPATHAHGMLTVYNGSIVQQELPAGMVFLAQDVEVITQTPVLVPASNPPTFGSATVSAHTVTAGARGNIPSFAINQVYGGSLFIRNLKAFSGGSDALTTRYTTAADRAQAIATARTRLTAQIRRGLLFRPCTETSTGNQIISVTWTCQFVTYHVSPSMRVLHVVVQGNLLVLDVVFPVPPHPFPGK